MSEDRRGMIEVRELCKYFGRITALQKLNLTIRAGESVALFGRNGAGKTTFLRILAGLTRPSSGKLKIHSTGRTGAISIRAAIGYLSHNTSLYLDLTAMENLRFYSRLMSLPCPYRILLDKIADVGLGGREREPVRNFSRGMQQRLAIARAFLHNPDILLLDEPFTGLDQAGAEFLKRYLADAHSQGKTLIMAVHDAQLGYGTADRLVVLEKGTVALDIPKRLLSLSEFQSQYEQILKQP